jgi:hypothetical protein
MSGRTWEDNKLAINELWPAYVFTGEERKLWTDDLSHLDQAMLYDAIRNAKRSHETPFPQIKWLTDAYRELNRLRKGATHFKDPQHPRLKVDVKDDENRRLVDDFYAVIDDAVPSDWPQIETSILDKLGKMHAGSALKCLNYARERLLGQRTQFGKVDSLGDVQPVKFFKETA